MLLASFFIIIFIFFSFYNSTKHIKRINALHVVSLAIVIIQLKYHFANFRFDRKLAIETKTSKQIETNSIIVKD